MVACAGVMIILAGLAVDLGGQVHAQERATDIAAQAARAGGEQLQAAYAIRGDGVRTDPTRALAAARSYLVAARMPGTVSLRGGTVVVVTATASYTTTFLSLIGIDRLQVTGTAQSRTVRAVHGTER